MCSLPIFTIGIAFSSMYSVMWKIINNEESNNMVKDFFKAFKRDFLKTTPITFVFLGMQIFVVWGVYLVFLNDDAPFRTFMLIIQTIVVAFFIVMNAFFIPLMARYKNTIKNHIRNSLLIMFYNPTCGFICIIVTLIPVILLVMISSYIAYMEIATFALLYYGLIGFAANAFCKTFFLSKVMERFAVEDESEETLDDEETYDSSFNFREFDNSENKNKHKN